MVPGIFMKTFDWKHPDFAPWKLERSDLNKAQRDALLSEHIDEICSPDLTTEQKIELCRTIPCRVELFHSNVCKGVEKSWPKRMFKKAKFDLLTPKEKRCLYRKMQAKAVPLYNMYVCSKRLANRRQRRTSRALAPYYEKQYRKNLFERINAIGKPAPGYDAIIDESVDLSDNEGESLQNSLETVINTGKTGTQKSNMDTDTQQIDASDNDCSSDVMSENAEHRSDVRPSNNWKSKTRNYEVQPFDNTSDIEFIASECNLSLTADEYNVEMSEDAASSSTKNTNLETQSQDHHFACFVPDELLADEVVFATPLRYRQRRNDLVDDGDVGADSEGEVETLDFLSQGITARTSTQQSNK